VKTKLLTAAVTMAASVIAVGALASCDAPPEPGVPSVSSRPERAATGGAGDVSDARRAKLHDAAQCIRQHGIPTYQDPVLTSDGHVYADARSVQDAAPETLDAVDQACGQLIAAAQFQPDEIAPAPPRLVAAGVKASQCLRANGLPNVKDPAGTSPFVPGHGFTLGLGELPADATSKDDPTIKRAFTACRALMDEEIRLSSLGNLAGA
jgi:hypothetical protein